MRGPKPKRVVNTTWSSSLAYAIGLLAADGCIAKHQPLIDLTSLDKEQLQNYKKCLAIAHVPISTKSNGKGGVGYRVQFKNILFYQWLQKIGFTSNKSKTIGPIIIPHKYFFDFLRGVIDGDGSFYSYYDPRWRSSFMFYLTLSSGSRRFVNWIQDELEQRLGVKGHIGFHKTKSIYQLKYAKTEASKIIKKMYYSRTVVCLARKRKKIENALKTNDQNNKAQVS